MKNKYLKELRSLLDLYDIDSVEKNEIVDDYSAMYDDAVLRGMNDEEVINYLGSPKLNIKDLSEGYSRINRAKGKEKLISISPFVATIIFFVLGLGFDLWHPGWLVFTIIPVTAIIVEMGSNKDSHMLTALSPFIASLIFLYLGFFKDLWHPGWLVFLIIPVIAILTERKTMKFTELLVSLSPFVTIVLFFYFGELDYWNPGWVVFLAIPALGILNEKSIVKILISEILLIGGVIAYLYIGFETEEWEVAALSFLPIIAYGFINGNIEIGGELGDKRIWFVSIASALLFLVLGFATGYWEYAWLVFIIIPVYSIYKYAPKGQHLVAMTPFLSFIIFFLLGMIGGFWTFSWMAFLLIPIVAILKES